MMTLTVVDYEDGLNKGILDLVGNQNEKRSIKKYCKCYCC